MHRSGTTLLERILSGHPDVADAGETYTFSAQLRYAADHFDHTIIDETILERARDFDYRMIGRGFLDHRAEVIADRPGRSRRLGNFHADLFDEEVWGDRGGDSAHVVAQRRGAVPYRAGV